MASKKKKPLLSRKELAAALECHKDSIPRWQDAGMPVAYRGGRGRPSKYDEVEVRAWLAAREEDAESTQPLDPFQERAKKDRAQRLLAEQMHAQRARELLPADEVEKVWGAERDAVRTRVLATYTTDADRVHRAAKRGGLRGVERALKELAYEILRELATPEPKTPARAKRKRRPAA